MYLDNVRRTIANLKPIERQQFLVHLRKILKDKYRKNVKPSELETRVREFVTGKEPKADYFEAYLLTFDELSMNGALEALKKGKVKLPITWRQLLLSVTSDTPVPIHIREHLNDELILKELKAVFKNVLQYCEDDQQDNFFENLQNFNKFISIKGKDH
ncbi:hypothetical protein [Bacillus sp. N1-1]|uniref:hypothetical protein n=1 Tax=Bacillus sp. N1-1 TaxID=2682541 RepID=UPI001357CDB9|nr:hypothetical protein [Bacillus sp. N1-1]